MSGRNLADQADQTPRLGVGALVFDTAEKALGVVMDTDEGDGRYSLRPPKGGIEWTAVRADLRLASVIDHLRPALIELNARSSGGSARG